MRVALQVLDVKRIINEPTAAALAYGIDKTQGMSVLQSTIWVAEPLIFQLLRLRTSMEKSNLRCWLPMVILSWVVKTLICVNRILIAEFKAG